MMVKYEDVKEDFARKDAEIKQLQAQVERLNKEVSGEIENRDVLSEALDNLASSVGEFFSVDLGEHSSANCPVANAFEQLDLSVNQVSAIKAEGVKDLLFKYAFPVTLKSLEHCVVVSEVHALEYIDQLTREAK